MKNLTIDYNLYKEELKIEYNKGWDKSATCLVDCVKEAMTLKEAGENDAAWNALLEFYENNDDTNKLAAVLGISTPIPIVFTEDMIPF